MPSAVAILTYQRQPVLAKTLDTLVKHVPPFVPVAIFDDCSLRDNTVDWLRSISTTPIVECGFRNLCDVIEAPGFVITYGNRTIEVFAAKQNLGVAANSNRALRWFSMTIGYDHLFLANDDLLFQGDAVGAYAQAHQDLDVGLLCFNNLKDDDHRWSIINCRGHRLKVFRKMTGAVMSLTRKLFDDIGYFDPAFGRFGEEHCDYTNRARARGFLTVLNKHYVCIDVEFKPPVLDHQHDAVTSIGGLEKDAADSQASQVMQEKLQEYRTGIFWQPFRLRHVPFTTCHAGFDSGIKPKQMLGYEEAPSLVVPFE